VQAFYSYPRKTLNRQPPNTIFDVHAVDIPEFDGSAALSSLYEKNEIPFAGLNLRDSKSPYDADSFDAVVVCDVLDHLNFDPLPALQEINRVLKADGYVSCTVPCSGAWASAVLPSRGSM